jgi:hypothetical protein
MEVDNEGSLLLVPIRENVAGCVALRTGRLPSGQRIGMAFTSEQALAEALGPDQRWITLCGRVARTMFAEAGAVQTRIDPQPYLPPQPRAEVSAIPTAARAKTRAPFGSRVRPHIRTRVSFSGARHAY